MVLLAQAKPVSLLVLISLGIDSRERGKASGTMSNVRRLSEAAMTLAAVLLVSQDAAQELTCLNARSGTVRWVPTQEVQ